VRIRRFWLIVVAILVPSAAGANDHVASVYAGGSYADASKLFGLHETLEIVFPKPWQRNMSLIGLIIFDLRMSSNRVITTRLPVSPYGTALPRALQPSRSGVVAGCDGAVAPRAGTT
jgi:hypothetical protein